MPSTRNWRVGTQAPFAAIGCRGVPTYARGARGRKSPQENGTRRSAHQPWCRRRETARGLQFQLAGTSWKVTVSPISDPVPSHAAANGDTFTHRSKKVNLSIWSSGSTGKPPHAMAQGGTIALHGTGVARHCAGNGRLRSFKHTGNGPHIGAALPHRGNGHSVLRLKLLASGRLLHRQPLRERRCTSYSRSPERFQFSPRKSSFHQKRECFLQ